MTATATDQHTLIVQITTILREDLGMSPWQAEEFEESLTQPNFFEFWFGGDRGGSLKVYIDRGVPYVVDQYNVKTLKAPVEAANAKIRALFA